MKVLLITDSDVQIINEASAMFSFMYAGRPQEQDPLGRSQLTGPEALGRQSPKVA